MVANEKPELEISVIQAKGPGRHKPNSKPYLDLMLKIPNIKILNQYLAFWIQTQRGICHILSQPAEPGKARVSSFCRLCHRPSPYITTGSKLSEHLCISQTLYNKFESKINRN